MLHSMLPGIAGIVLAMGMAVDANVLIFERIREELRSGKKVRAAIEAGYSRALSTIVDSNLHYFGRCSYIFLAPVWKVSLLLCRSYRNLYVYSHYADQIIHCVMGRPETPYSIVFKAAVDAEKFSKMFRLKLVLKKQISGFWIISNSHRIFSPADCRILKPF